LGIVGAAELEILTTDLAEAGVEVSIAEEPGLETLVVVELIDVDELELEAGVVLEVQSIEMVQGRTMTVEDLVPVASE
jgi:hypothetical protein